MHKCIKLITEEYRESEGVNELINEWMDVMLHLPCLLFIWSVWENSSQVLEDKATVDFQPKDGLSSDVTHHWGMCITSCYHQISQCSGFLTSSTTGKGSEVPRKFIPS